MGMIKVIAAEGLRVPLVNHPHEYIGQEPVEIDGEDLYYRRLLMDGDLLAVADEPETAKSKGAK